MTLFRRPVRPGPLRLTKDEQVMLKESGLVPGDLASMSPDDIVMAFEGEIDVDRAEALRARASLLTLTDSLPYLNVLLMLGVRDREDLASRDPDDLYASCCDLGLDHVGVHDLLSMAVYIAGTPDPDPKLMLQRTWAAKREASGFDPALVVWHWRYGRDTPLPKRTKQRLRMRTINAGAWLATSEALVPPTDPREATCVDDVLLGHWRWAGRTGAFRRLEHLKRSDVLEITGRSEFEVLDVYVGEPVDLDPGSLTLTTVPYRPRLDSDEIVQVVVRAEPRA